MVEIVKELVEFLARIIVHDGGGLGPVFMIGCVKGCAKAPKDTSDGEAVTTWTRSTRAKT